MTTNVPGIRAAAGSCIPALTILLLSILTTGAQPPAPRTPPPEPYFDGRKQQLDYPGPGRDEPDPEGLAEVLIGYFGPSDPADPLGGDLWLAAQMALQEANATGGYQGLPFRLLPAWSENPWQAGIAQVTHLVFKERVWALIGSIDGPSTHLVEQVVTKALLPLVNPASTDETVNYAYVPWMFSVPPSDGQQAAVLGPAIQRAVGSGRLVVLSANDHDSQMAMKEYTTFLQKQGLTPWRLVQYESGSLDRRIVAEIAAGKPEAILVCSQAADSGSTVRVIRQAGCQGAVFGTSTLGRRAFLDRAGESAEEIVFPIVYDPSPAYEGFVSRLREKLGHDPDFAACHTYDTTRLVIAAIRRAGLNRIRIRDAIRELSPFQGITGMIRWDAVGQNVRTVRLGTIRNGRVVVK